MIIGTETEYTVSIIAGGETHRATRATLRELLQLVVSGQVVNGLKGAPVAWGSKDDYFLTNGDRLYLDEDFAEYATRECFNGLQVRIAELAGLDILRDACEALSERTGQLVEIRYVGSNGSDTAGYHENYGLRPEHYSRLFTKANQPSALLDNIVVPFLVSRIIWSGLYALTFRDGRVLRPASPKILSPRASLVRHTYRAAGDAISLIRIHRPSRIERDASRLCISSGDFRDNANDPFATFTLDLTSIILTFAAQGLLSKDYSLENPPGAIRAINENRWAKVRLQRGGFVNGLTLQRAIFADTWLASDAASFDERLEVSRELFERDMDEWHVLLEEDCA
jgi:hypothetical protein